MERLGDFDKLCKHHTLSDDQERQNIYTLNKDKIDILVKEEENEQDQEPLSNKLMMLKFEEAF